MSKVKNIISLFLRHNYPNDVQQDVQQWLISNRFVEEKDNILKHEWDELEAPRAGRATRRSYRRVRQRIDTAEGRRGRRVTVRVLRPLLKVAAVIALPLLTGWATYLYMQHNARPPEMLECFAPNASVESVTLPDGSQVHLNAGSILLYPKTFVGGERSVYLNGEALFSVTHEASQPFVVHTQDVNIRVLGTRFNVCSYADDIDVAVTLESGRVELQLKADGQTLALEPSEQARYNRDRHRLSVSAVNPATAVAWLRGHIIFRNTRFRDAVKMLERHYNVSIYVTSSRLDGEMLNVKFQHGESLQQTLDVLHEIVPKFNYRIKGEVVFVE